MGVSSRDYRKNARGIIQDKPEVREAVTAATRTFHENRTTAFAELDCRRPAAVG